MLIKWPKSRLIESGPNIKITGHGDITLIKFPFLQVLLGKDQSAEIFGGPVSSFTGKLTTSGTPYNGLKMVDDIVTMSEFLQSIDMTWNMFCDMVSKSGSIIKNDLLAEFLLSESTNVMSLIQHFCVANLEDRYIPRGTQYTLMQKLDRIMKLNTSQELYLLKSLVNFNGNMRVFKEMKKFPFSFQTVQNSFSIITNKAKLGAIRNIIASEVVFIDCYGNRYRLPFVDYRLSNDSELSISTNSGPTTSKHDGFDRTISLIPIIGSMSIAGCGSVGEVASLSDIELARPIPFSVIMPEIANTILLREFTSIDSYFSEFTAEMSIIQKKSIQILQNLIKSNEK